MPPARRPALRGAAVVAVIAAVLVAATPAIAAKPTPHPTQARTTTLSRDADGPRSAVDAVRDPEPLQVTLTSLTPSVVPRKGPIQMTGTVRNVSRQTWQDINVHTWVSTEPITTRDDLATAAATPYDADVGERLTTTNGFVPAGDLKPGDQTTFSLRVPRDELSIPDSPGVYWLGVQVLGTGDDGRAVAGRARTFIPQVEPGGRRSAVSLVLPVRQQVVRDGLRSNRLADPSAWNRLLDDDGRLERILGLAETSGSDQGSLPVSLLVDPAVLDAVRSASAGDSDAASRAKAWLVRFRALAQRQQVLGLGYGDPDVAALARRSQRLLTVATTQSADAFAGAGVQAVSTVAPIDGSLAPRHLDLLDPSTTVLLSDAAVPDSPGLARTRTGQPLVVADTQASSGGPAPMPGTDALAERQRILAEAALHRTGVGDPLVVSLPAAWDPGPDWSSSGFFAGLRVPWLRLVRPDPRPDAPVPDRILYTDSLIRRQISAAQVDAVTQVRHEARVYADAVTDPGDLLAALTRTGLEGASYYARDEPRTSLARSRELADGVRDRLSGVRVDGVPLITMSGGSGTFTVSLVNGLSRPVKVGLTAKTSGGLRITAPAAQVLPANQRTTVRLRASAGESRVRSVTLTPSTANGYAVGTPLRFSVRNSRVSSLVWGVMAAAFALLLVTIVRRAVRRGLRRRTQEP